MLGIVVKLCVCGSLVIVIKKFMLHNINNYYNTVTLAVYFLTVSSCS